MYTKIRKQEQTLNLYAKRLLNEDVCTQEEINDVKNKYENILQEAYQNAEKETKSYNKDWLDSPWHGFFGERDQYKDDPTGVSIETIKHIGHKFGAPPSGDLSLIYNYIFAY